MWRLRRTAQDVLSRRSLDGNRPVLFLPPDVHPCPHPSTAYIRARSINDASHSASSRPPFGVEPLNLSVVSLSDALRVAWRGEVRRGDISVPSDRRWGGGGWTYEGSMMRMGMSTIMNGDATRLSVPWLHPCPYRRIGDADRARAFAASVFRISPGGQRGNR